MFDGIKKEFPIFDTHSKLAYFDSGASAQKPAVVLKRMNDFLRNEYANIHRGVYNLSSSATLNYESVRTKVADFLNVSSDEIVFTSGATSAINLVASSWGSSLSEGDEILISEYEHHANIVPWHFLKEKGIVIKSIPYNKEGTVVDDIKSLVTEKTKLIAITQLSNVLGLEMPIKEICDVAHSCGAKVLVDGAQGVLHGNHNIKELGCDFYVFSGHKIYGPTGVGVLWSRKEILNDMKPWQGGGDMIDEVYMDHSTYQEAPYRFEAGTPPITEVIGLGAAIDWFSKFSSDEIKLHDEEIMKNVLLILDNYKVKRFGPDVPVGCVSFVMNGVHPHDVATLFDKEFVAVRAGHHCAQPLIRALSVPATVRLSIGLYNDGSDIEALDRGLFRVRKIFGE